MKDKDKTKEQLITEVAELRQWIDVLKKPEYELNRLQEELRKTEQERTAILDSMAGLVLYHDTRMRILWTNKAAGESVGVDPQQLVGRHCYEIWHQRRRPCVGCPVVKARKSGQPQEAEMTSPDGRVWSVRGYPVRGKKGNIAGLVEIVLEITDRKQIEEALKVEKEFSESMLNAIIDTVFVFDPSTGKPLRWNKAFNKISGYSDKEIALMKAPGDWYSKEDLKRAEATTKKILQEGYGTVEMSLITKEGKRIPTEYMASSITDAEGKPLYIIALGRDITERKQAEDVLRENEEKLKNIVENSTNVFYSHTPEHIITYHSPQVKNILGYEPDEAMVRWTDFASDNPINEEGLKLTLKAIETGKPQPPYEMELVHKNGKKVWVEVREAPVVVNGKTISIVGALTDITERKQAEEALRESEDRFRIFADEVSFEGIIIHDEGKILDVNRQFSMMHGYERSELIGMMDSLVKTIVPEYREIVLKHIQEGYEKPYEAVALKKDGSTFPIEIHAKTIPSHGKMVRATAIRDITDRKQAEEALRTSEAQLSNAMEIAKLGYWEYDVAEDIFTFNDHFYEIFRTTAEKVGGYKMSSEQYAKQFVHLDDISVVGIEIRKAIETTDQNFSRQLDHRIIYADGEIGYISVRFFIVKDSHGRTVKTYGANQDITERKRMEEELRESEGKLKNIVENSTNLFYSHTPEHVLTYLSPQVKDILGYKPDEAMVRWTELASDNPINEEGFKLTVKAIETGKPQPPYELELVHKNGKKVWVEVREAPVVVNGKTISIVGALTDITDRKQAEEALQRSFEQLRETSMTTVSALTSMVEMKDRYTAGHQPKVAQLACAIAEEMKLSNEQIEGIRIAGLVHDIGKIMVPAEILSKPGPLTDIQFDMVKMHPQAGYDILKGIKFPWPVAQIVLQHHERMDGSGYPQGLSGEEIILEARILGVANVVEAMTSHRPYRAAHDIKEALQEISQHKEIFYDPDVANACLKLFAKKRFTFD